MEGTYDVMLGPEKRGTVTVTAQGLYWVIQCRCRLYSDVMQNLVVRTGGNYTILGLLVPEGGSYYLRTRIAKKELPKFDGFSLRPRHEKMQEDFYPIKPEVPFAYLGRLEDAYLVRKGGEIGLVLNKKK